MSKRLILATTDEMHEALKQQAAERGATTSGLVRMILGQWLEAQGEPVEWRIEWGGHRRGEHSPAPEEDEGS